MQQHWAGTKLVQGAITGALLVWCGATLPAQTAAPDRSGAGTAPSGDGPAEAAAPKGEKPAAEAVSRSAQQKADVDEIVKLVEAGVSKDVIRVYIEHSSKPYHLEGPDVIALKAHGVSDDLTTAMIKRGAEVAAQTEPGRAGVPGAGRAVREVRVVAAGFDPESYNFWYYHYAYPRALAAANQRLLSSYYPSFMGSQPYGYGYFGPLPYGPRSAFGWSPSRFPARFADRLP